MGDTVLKVEHLGKEYRLGTISHGTLYRDLQSWSARLRGKEDPNSKISSAGGKVQNGTFTALDDVSFEVKQGDVLGIIGRNGAGKSTLLKIISRVTAPTRGEIKIRGRVASLLEVGTGFHPELTGRENIFLNGTILGMTKKEIHRKFDEIVDFAEVENFIDTPVKRYSSGMYVKLAFAVAAHLEPEILIIDEVLAVGDVKFQKKCLGKMRSIGNEGRTVLFVSHNMNAIEQLCSKAILLQNGHVALSTDRVRLAINKYLNNDLSNNESVWEHANETKNRFFNLTRMYLSNVQDEIIYDTISNNEVVFVNIEGEIKEYDNALQIGYALYNEDNQLVFWSLFNDAKEDDWPIVTPGKIRFYSLLPPRFLNEGSYKLELIAALYYREWINQPCVNSPYICFSIQGGLSDSPYWLVRRPGLLAPVLSWHTSNLD